MKSRLFKLTTLSIASFSIVLYGCYQYEKKKSFDPRRNYSMIDTASEILITPLPFGPEDIITYNFPNNGWSNGEDEIMHGEKNKDSVYQKKFEQIDEVFSKINFSKTIVGPIIKKAEYINIDDDSLIITHYPGFQNDFKFRLPDEGPFECFYQYHESPQTHAIITKDGKKFFTYGNIVLYDKKTYSAKFINVFNGFNFGNEDFGGSERLFVVEKNGMIDIVKSPIAEQFNAITKLSKILIDKNGKIAIEKLK